LQNRGATRLVLAIALALHAAMAAVAAARSPRPARDFERYFEIGRASGRPYVDYQVEHPIGTLLVFKALAHLPGGRVTFGVAVVGVAVIADATIVAALAWGWGLPAAAVFAAILLPVIDLLFNRVDSWSTAAATVAVAAWRRDRPVLLGSGLAIGGAFKLWPLVLTPLLVIPHSVPPSILRGGGSNWTPARRATPAAAVAFLIAGTALAALALGLAGPASILQVLTFRGSRGWQIESTVGSLIHLASSSALRWENGSWRIGATNGWISIALFLIAGPICLWSTWRGARLSRTGTGWLGAVATLMVISALLSAQFVIWLAPAAGIAWTDGDRRPAVLAALAIVLTGAFWIPYDWVLDGRTPVLLVVVIRNVVLAALSASALGILARGPAVGAHGAPAGACGPSEREKESVERERSGA
jgi:hypothetical protein